MPQARGGWASVPGMGVGTAGASAVVGEAGSRQRREHAAEGLRNHAGRVPGGDDSGGDIAGSDAR